MSQKDKKKKHSPFVISKLIPTQYVGRVKPQICDQAQLAFAACGNAIKVFSLKTGIQVGQLRSARLMQAEQPGFQYVHKGNIVGMQLMSDDESQNYSKLLTVCSRGTLAEWDIKDLELLNVIKIDVG